ncbi:MAG: hypothetical protein ACREDU_11325, partial [Methylocella sp.]
RAAAAALGDAIGVIDGVGKIAMAETYKKAELDGQVAGSAAGNQRDAQGNLLPLTSLPDPGTAYGRAYANAAIANYSISAQTDAGIKANDLMEEFQNDPETLRTKWNEYQTATLKALDPTVASQLESQYVRIGGEAYGKVVSLKRKRVRDETEAGIENQIEGRLNSAYNMADEMGWSSGGMVERASDMLNEVKTLLLQKQAVNPDFNNAMIDRALKVAQRNILTRSAVAEAWKIADGNRRGVGGIGVPDTDGALRWLDNMVADPPEEFAALFSPDELMNLRQQGGAWINAKDSEERIGRAQAQQANTIASIGKVSEFQTKVENSSTPADLNNLLRMLPTMSFSNDPVDNARAQVAFTDKIQ